MLLKLWFCQVCSWLTFGVTGWWLLRSLSEINDACQPPSCLDCFTKSALFFIDCYEAIKLGIHWSQFCSSRSVTREQFSLPSKESAFDEMIIDSYKTKASHVWLTMMPDLYLDFSFSWYSNAKLDQTSWMTFKQALEKWGQSFPSSLSTDKEEDDPHDNVDDDSSRLLSRIDLTHMIWPLTVGHELLFLSGILNRCQNRLQHIAASIWPSFLTLIITECGGTNHGDKTKKDHFLLLHSGQHPKD